MRGIIIHAGLVAILLASLPLRLQGQGVNPPLSIQGLDRFEIRSARMVSMGGTGVALGNDANALFVNPASLSQLTGLEARVGLEWANTQYVQTQQWIPNRFYPTFSLLMEHLIGWITPPNTTDPQAQLQRSYDTMLPNWKEIRDVLRPAVLSAAVPFKIGGVRVVGALGAAQMFNLDYFYRNNNGLDPNIGNYRPEPLSIVRSGDSLIVQWFATARERKGAIYGITPAVSLSILENLSVGASLAILTGRSDDAEQRIDRGKLVFSAVYTFRNDSVDHSVNATATSKYSGLLPQLGAFYHAEAFSIGVSVRLPGTITRAWDKTTTETRDGTGTTFATSGEDKVRLPASVSLGLALRPGKKWSIGVDYVMRGYQNAELTPGGGATVHPWLGGSFLRAGAEYRPLKWLALRGGYRDDLQVFAPDGTGLLNDPARGSVYSGGVGISLGRFGFDIAYEYSLLKYDETWMTNVNYNKVERNSIILETSVRLGK
jgi:hypothetical protein